MIRKFLKLFIVGASALLLGACSEETDESYNADTVGADLIVINGDVYTSDPAAKRAEAFAVQNGKFVAIGSTTDIQALAGPNTEVIDAGKPLRQVS